jgi:hypothetical protein
MIEKNFDIGFIMDLALREKQIQQNYRIGDSLESAIEEVLTKSGIIFRKTKRAERIAGFDQSPDFFIATRGKVFTLITLNRLVDCTRLKEFHTQPS